MGKPTICIGENKSADQLRSNLEADQRLCFRYSDSTTPLLLKSKVSSFYLFSVLVQAGLCRTCSETTLLVFPRGGSFNEVKRLYFYFVGSRYMLGGNNNIMYLQNKIQQSFSVDHMEKDWEILINPFWLSQTLSAKEKYSMPQT